MPANGACEILFVILLVCTLASANSVRYVSNNVHTFSPNGANCTDKQEPCTFSYALSFAEEGDTLLMSGGAYTINQKEIFVTNITISGDPANPPSVNCSGGSREMSGTSLVFHNPVQVTLANLEFMYCETGVSFTSSSGAYVPIGAERLISIDNVHTLRCMNGISFGGENQPNIQITNSYMECLVASIITGNANIYVNNTSFEAGPAILASLSNLTIENSNFIEIEPCIF